MSTTATEKHDKLKPLYELLLKAENIMDDRAFDETGEQDFDEPYICFDQVIIFWRNGRYVLCDIYDSFKNIQFETAEEVVSFFEGYSSGDTIWNSEDGKKTGLIPTEKAQNVGIYLHCMATISMTKKYYEAVISESQQKMNEPTDAR